MKIKWIAFLIAELFLFMNLSPSLAQPTENLRPRSSRKLVDRIERDLDRYFGEEETPEKELTRQHELSLMKRLRSASDGGQGGGESSEEALTELAFFLSLADSTFMSYIFETFRRQMDETSYARFIQAL